MTSNSIEERRQYVNRVRASFGTSVQNDNQEPEMEVEGNAFDLGFFKLKALLAVAIFAAFIYCDQNQVIVYNKKAEDVYKQIEETIDVENLMQNIENMIP